MESAERKQVELSIVVPVFEEAGRLERSIEQMAEFSAGLGFEHEVIWVVEKSSDGSLELAAGKLPKQENFKLVDNKVHRGKGYAVRTGMGLAAGTFVFYMDLDLSVPLEEVSAFLGYFKAHPEVDVVVGNRQHADSRILRRQNWLREKMGQAFNWLIRRLAPVTIHDTQCGFKAFRREAARQIFARQTIDGFAFDVEVLLLAQHLGFCVRDLPVRWINSPESKVRILRDSLQMLEDVFRARRAVQRVRQAALRDQSFC